MRNVTALKSLLALGSLSGAVWASTSATFTDTQTAASTFTTGTVDLRLNADSTGAYAFTSLALTGAKPTDVVYAPLTVSNNGTLPYTYTMTSSHTNTDSKALKDVLTLEARLVATSGTCDSGGVGFGNSGTTVIASGALKDAAISTPRALASGASEVLCVKVAVPSGTGDAYQGAATTSTFSFAATQ